MKGSRPPLFSPSPLTVRALAVQARLLALPGVLTLISLLAVLWGTPQPLHDHSPRMTAGNSLPTLPELRPAPQPPLPLPVLASPPRGLELLLVKREDLVLRPPDWRAPELPFDLTWWGRQQTDGA